MSDAKKARSAKKKLSKKQLKKQLKKQGKKQGKAVLKIADRQGKAARKADKREKAARKAAKKLAKSMARASVGKKRTAAKPAKSKKATGRACPAKAQAPALSLTLDLGTCPCCSKRCPLAKPKCGKGRAVARKKRERLMGGAVA